MTKQQHNSLNDLYYISRIPFCVVSGSGQELCAYPKEFAGLYRPSFYVTLIAALDQGPYPDGVLEYNADEARSVAVTRLYPGAYLVTAPAADAEGEDRGNAGYIREGKGEELLRVLRDIPPKPDFTLARLALLGKRLCGEGGAGDEICVKYYDSDEVIPLRRHEKTEGGQSARAYRRATAASIRYIHRRLYQRISVQEISEHVHLNRSTLSAYFKQDTGMTITAFISSAKLNEAKRLLEDRTVGYPQIIDLLGFCNQSYFIKKFREHFGMTPQQYRRYQDRNKQCALECGSTSAHIK